jgi:beta-lactamase class A
MNIKSKLVTRRFSLIHIILTAAVMGFSFFIYNQSKSIGDLSNAKQETNDAKIDFVRNQDYKFTKPLIGFDLDKPSKNLTPLNIALQKVVSGFQDSGNLYNASVYLRDLESSEWTMLNEEEKYHPGSLIKVPMLMYYLKKAQSDNTILDHKLMLTKIPGTMPNQTYNAQQVEVGKEYTIRELLKYMAAYSDNNATMLLNNYCNIAEFKTVFSTLGIPVPDVTDTNFVMSVKEYSVFMRSLYNATFLSPQNSDFALSLLAESSFTNGLTDKLPKDIVVARKFGESFRSNKRELHESGIIYCNKRPYILVVMTKGANQQNQASFISSVSEVIFKSFCI